MLSRVGDEVAFGAENLGVPRAEIWERVHAALDDVGLRVPLEHSTAALSGGQKQRLALASILAMSPGLLLLDEPTANLDPDGVLEIRDAVERVLEGTGATLIVVEHRVAAWAELVDRVIVLDAGGGLLADGPPEEVLTAEQTRARLAEAGVWLPGAALDVPPPLPPGHRAGTARCGKLDVARTPEGQSVLTGSICPCKAGDALGITGPNGAGKSTLALTLGGLLRPRAGKLTAAPRRWPGEAGNIPSKWKSAQLVTRIGTVFQEPEHQFLTGSVRDELAFGPRRGRAQRHGSPGHRGGTGRSGCGWPALLQATRSRCPAGRNAGCPWPPCSLPRRTSCSWTNPPSDRTRTPGRNWSPCWRSCAGTPAAPSSR